MKIAYWSCEKGQAGTTTNLAVVSVMLALEQRMNSILLENHYNPANLETILERRDEGMVREEAYFYNQRGMDFLMRQIDRGKNPRTAVRQASLSFVQERVRYIPQNLIFNKEVFAYQLQQRIFPVLGKLEGLADFIGIDLESRGNASTGILLKEADIIVVNLSQNAVALENFFTNYDYLCPKAVFIVGRYQAGQDYSLARICREFPVKKESIGIIPYDREFSNALYQGHLISFLSKNYHVGNFHKNYAVMRECKNCSRLLLKKMKDYSSSSSS